MATFGNRLTSAQNVQISLKIFPSKQCGVTSQSAARGGLLKCRPPIINQFLYASFPRSSNFTSKKKKTAFTGLKFLNNAYILSKKWFAVPKAS